ncbi:MAG: autotransporter outer membrane beta-barrel domain-containing protein, partial [Acidaminococcaceae bacterium]|nr:autotransporter outer membrane beta-barrel domain-containing protein [Acidaminococcaceae bacterium]
TFAKDGVARAFDNTYDVSAATIGADDLVFTNPEIMETGNTMTIVDASNAIKNANGETLATFADKEFTLAFSETNTEKNATVAGTHTDTLSQDAAKTKLAYTVGAKDVKTVDLGTVDFVKGSTLFDRSGAGYNYAGVTALGTDGFAVSYASPETVAMGDSMTLLQANATLKDMAEQVKQTSYSFTPVSGVTIDANITGKLAASGGAVTYTAAANQASKLTFTNVDWKDSGALMTRPKNITFAGADVDTAKIRFQNVKELDANRTMTLVSDFGNSVGTITGTKYTVGAGLEGEGAASLSGSNLVFTTKTGARDLAAQAQTHNTLMVMEAGMAVLAAGNEYVGQTMAELANPQNAGLDGTVTAASLGGSRSRYKTGSHVDSNNWNVAVAVGSKRDLKKGSLEWGVFGEYGKADYTLHSDAGRGDGDSHYAGGGLMAKWTNKHDVYTEASVRMGRLNDSASNLLWDAAGNGYGYDVHTNYFGAHVGIGKMIRYKGGKSLDVYGKYFYTKRDGVDFMSGGNNYSLDSVASSILRVGARYGTTEKKWNWYGGLAYEYEFDGKSEGVVDGVTIRSASIKGSSVRGEIGMRMNATKTNPWQTDISIYGYGGKHRGIGGNVNVAYMF